MLRLSCPAGVVDGAVAEVMPMVLMTVASLTGHSEPPSDAFTKASGVAGVFEQATADAHASSTGHAACLRLWTIIVRISRQKKATRAVYPHRTRCAQSTAPGRGRGRDPPRDRPGLRGPPKGVPGRRRCREHGAIRREGWRASSAPDARRAIRR